MSEVCRVCKGEVLYDGINDCWDCCGCGRRFNNDGCGPATEIDYDYNDDE